MRAYEFITEGNDREYHTGGSLGLPFPGTYEQEYNMFKSKGPRRITAMTNEALDSSYEYFRSRNALDNEFKFVTEDGISYSVVFSGKDLVEVAFSAILPGEENNFRPNKTTLTGTGNSRKVFGTVIKIVQEFVEEHKPKALYFTADNSEPSRVRLYNTMLSQVDKALPDYTSSGNVDLGTGTAYMLRRKEEVTEALDTSYEYVPGQKPGVFYFETEDGNQYKVDFSGNNKKTEVAFAQRGQGDEHKTGLTGTGNSRKIFGTVINIVKDYMSKAKPDMLIFNANNSEPSRVRLYKMLANQADSALPEYNFAKALSDGTYTTYYLTRNDVKVPVLDKVKAAGFKALDKIVGEGVENTITLNDLYDGSYPDQDEQIWNHVGDNDFDIPFEIHTIRPMILSQVLEMQYGVDDIEDLFYKMQPDQEAVVRDYENDPNLSQQIIVFAGNWIVDGNHRALAAVLANKPIKYINISEEVDEG